MTVSPEEIDRRMAAFMEACREHGFKTTHQRIEIFREVAGTEEHPDAETVFERVRRRVPTISLDTVYRTLTTLGHLKVIQRVYALCDRTRFDANMRRHHHLVCVTCGEIRDFESAEIDRVQLPPEVHAWGTLESIHVEARAVCPRCLAQRGSR